MNTTVDPDLLASFVPMNALSQASLANLARGAKFRDAVAGDLLFPAGEDRSTTFFLVKGELRLEDSRGRVLKTLRTGETDACHRIGQQTPAPFIARCVDAVRALSLDSGLLDVYTTWDQSRGLEVGELGAGAQISDDDWMARLLQIPAFRRVPPINLQAVFLRMREVRFDHDEIVLRQHDPGEYFYVIVEGRCAVMRETPGHKPVVLAELEPGNCFGEEALIGDKPRNATVRMLGAGRLMRLDRADFQTLLREPMLSRLDYAEAQQQVLSGAAKWLDVRLPAEYQSGHFPGSINLPLHLLREELSQLDSTTRYIVVCDRGHRGSVAVAILCQKGYSAHLLQQEPPTSYASADPC